MIGNLEYYKVFYYAASYESITKAAVALSVSVSYTHLRAHET